MTDVWSGSTAGARTGRRKRSRALLALIPPCCLSVGAVFSATLLGPGAPAGADQISTLQTQAAQLTSEMTLEQLQVGGYEQQSRAATAQAQSDEAALAQTQAAIAHIRHHLQRVEATLQQSAVTAYVDAGGTAGTSPFSSVSSSDNTAVYEEVVTGNLSGNIAQLRSTRRALQAEEATEAQLTAADAQAVNEANVMLTDAQQTEASLQAQSAQINAQLATAIAQEQRHEAQAAQAARVAATAAVTQAQATDAPAVLATPSSAPASGSVTAGPLPPFLVCVLQAESGGDYQAVSPTGGYMGGFQFSQTTWNHAAELAGLPTLVGVPPYEASPADQNALAIALYDADGEQPWYDPCRT